MRRREFIAGTAATAVSLVSDAHAQQQRGRVWHVGVLGVVPPTADMLGVFRDGLRERGYVEGQNLSIDVRSPQGSSFERNPGVATELVHSNVDAIVTWATEATMAVSRATSTTPSVMVGTG